MDMRFSDTFESFSALMRERFTAEAFTTEDSVRYTFYCALTASGVFKHTDVVLEYPHPVIPGAEIDTLIRPSDGRPSVAIEFKYDRGNPGGSNQNRTQRAAAALSDVFRLVKIPESIAALKYFVYVTDAEMASYFKNPANRLHQFFDSNSSAKLALGPTTFLGFSQTFVSRVSPLVCDCDVLSTFAVDLPSNHCIRVWEILPSNRVAGGI